MFGEGDSESPRLGSPWEALSSSPSPASLSSSVPSDFELEIKNGQDDCIPRLAPEIEQGNVEYKLKLVNPTVERFTRLVTQLKWRLLEGGGQALYEIGVSDSGQLVGLTRDDLDQSLETLERMAGELGATVIVLKEISIPAVMVDQAGLRFQNRIDGGARLPRRRLEDMFDGEHMTPPAVTDTEASETEELSPAAKPFITPIDSGIDLALLSLKTAPRPIIRTYPYGNTPYMTRGTIKSRIVQPATVDSTSLTFPTASDEDEDPAFAFDFDISTFPKLPSVAPVTAKPFKDKGLTKTKKKHSNPNAAHKTAHREREHKLRTGGFKAAKPVTVASTITPTIALDAVKPTSTVIPHKDSLITTAVAPAITVSRTNEDPVIEQNSLQPRLIVEALVVRKLSAEEAFLDFEGFSLE